MAPEFPPSLVILDTHFEDDTLRASSEYVEPLRPGECLRVLWGVEHPEEDFSPVGDGVVFVHRKGDDFVVVRVRTDVTPPDLGGHRYFWREGLERGKPWVMFILILPAGYTLDQPDPLPANARIFKDRITLYWVLRVDDLNRTKVAWSVRSMRGSMKEELTRIYRLVAQDAPSQTDSFRIEVAKTASSQETSTQRNPWKSGSFYWIAGLSTIVVLAVISRNVNAWFLAPLLVAALLLLVAIGALQLRNDEALKDETFLKLMVEILKRLTLISRPGKRDR